ncbi:hypothetical protein RhiirC2_786066 [Rhizophagus irregularis]|uniref:Uncharacterized protein n=1 Tax=Rhizophagus irregularis TaxID=588596 RepID=A0A2N1MV78_9GLOM|nr:hypothetical protein RhiirC2_786066 [Rhizophagus irregularis]
MADLIKSRKRYLYPYHCICYDGAEVDFRTQENHTNDESLWNSEDTRKNQEDTITARKQKRLIIIQDVNLTKNGFNPFNEDTDSFQPNNNENIHTLFSSSPLLPNPSYFHVPAPDENNYMKIRSVKF